MNITKTISLLDELRVKIGNRDIEINKDHIPQECALFIKAVVENYQSLRQAALDGERHRKAAKILENYLLSGTLPEDDCAALTLYRQAVEQKEV